MIFIHLKSRWQYNDNHQAEISELNLERRIEHWSSTQLAVDKTPGIVWADSPTVGISNHNHHAHDNVGSFAIRKFIFLVTSEMLESSHIIWCWKEHFQTMLKLNVVLTLTLTSLSSARLVETSLGPVMGERFTIIIIGDKNHPRPHQDIHSGPTLWRSSHYLWFILGAPLCRSSCRCVIHIIHEKDNICWKHDHDLHEKSICRNDGVVDLIDGTTYHLFVFFFRGFEVFPSRGSNPMDWD